MSPWIGETRRECAEFFSSGLRLERFPAGRGGLRASCAAGSAAGNARGARQPARRPPGHRLRRFHRPDPGGQLGQRGRAGHRLPGQGAVQRGIGGQGRRSALRDRSPALPGPVRSGRGPGEPLQGPTQACPGDAGPRRATGAATRPGRSARSNSTRTAPRSTRPMPRSRPRRPAWRSTSSIWISAR